MKILFALLFLNQLLFASTENLNVSDDLSWVDKVKFEDKKTVKYNKEEDVVNFKSQTLDVNNLILSKESLDRFDSAALSDQLKSNSTADPLVKISLLCNLKKFDEAFNEIDSVYSKYKNNPNYWNQVGTCYYLNKDFSKAILFYNKSRDLDSKYIPPINNLGVLYFAQGKFQKALAAFKKASEMSNFSLTPMYNRMSLLLKFGITSTSLPLLETLVKKAPKDTDLKLLLAYGKLLSNKLDDALKIYQSVPDSELIKNSESLNYVLTLTLLKKNDEAKKMIDRLNFKSDSDSKEYLKSIENLLYSKS